MATAVRNGEQAPTAVRDAGDPGVTADTITVEQIRALRDAMFARFERGVDTKADRETHAHCESALNEMCHPARRREARGRCADVLNAPRPDLGAKRPKSSYPHTLTSEQFAIISVALDSAREREAAYVERHEDKPDDHLKALDELRALLAFAGPIVLCARRSA